MSFLPRLALRSLSVRQPAALVLARLPATPVFVPAVRTFTNSALLQASGQGGREVKAKKKSKGAIKLAEKIASKKKGSKAVEEDEDDDDDDWSQKRTPRSEQIEVDNTATEVKKAGIKMKGFSQWFSEKTQEAIDRGRGKVSSSALDSIRVVLPKTTNELSLSAISTISIKANALIINVFDESHTKTIENAIHKANLPGMSPSSTDARTIKITVPRPSSSDRASMLKNLMSLAESSKQNVRQARMASMKILGKDGSSELQEVTDKYTKEIDGLLGKAKKELA
ncbi:Ribosome recycling factor domain [Phaffia rhodozyma]|uniref:Ribosome recycling factor domain n=1 Tax=Phaffia rhodozyma TaxID=264483 RepID=A0A0F7SI28_PHARH|nr:Ribosome recycling factor domain [Phaffia rhodozyma]